MASNNSLNLIDLDFDSLKTSLKSYMRGQEQFRDYDFEGSSLGVLIDLLSYNTYKGAFFTNMLFSESYLDSAQLRASVLSRSKELNYTPRSARSASATLRVTFEATGENQPYTIAKGESFSTLVKNDAFLFSIPDTVVVASPNTSYSFDVEVFEGHYVKDSYVVSASDVEQRFRLTNKNVDTRSLTVTVYEDNSVLGTSYTQASTLLGLTETSKVFFLQASDNGYYEIIFGDNALGQRPKNQAIVVLDYRLSAASKPNGASVFTANFDPTGLYNELISNIEVECISSGKNGADEESLASVRYYAPRHFQVQERAVTSSDYEILLKTQFQEINAVSVYGGEEVDPPQFGRVFVAVDISDVDGIPESKKTEYYNFLKPRSPLSIDPVFVDPEMTYMSIMSTVRYNINITNATKETIKTLITNDIIDYNETNLDDFGVTLRNSQFTKMIDESHPAIVSNVTDVEMYREVNPSINTLQNIQIKFSTALVNNLPAQASKYPIDDTSAVRSSRFRLNGDTVFLQDDGNGKIRVVRSEGVFNVAVMDVGTVDYETGKISLNNFKLSSYEGSALRIYVKPRDKDITSPKNTILTLKPADINLTIEPIRV